MTVTVAEALDEAARRLSGTRTPRLDAEVLLASLMGGDRTRLYIGSAGEVPGEVLERFRGLVERRCSGVPVAYLTGYREFYSRRYRVTPDVLIPRPETETLVEVALDWLGKNGLSRPRVLDLGTGSGILAATLSLEVPGSEVVAVELCPRAAAVARENFHRLRARVELLEGDLFAPVRGRFDLIVSNPPYVGTERGPQPEENVRRNEPAAALFSGPSGLEVLRRIWTQAPDFLVEGGVLAMEVAPHQSEGVEAAMRERGFRRTRLVPDLAGLPRVVSGCWEEETDDDLGTR
ncbi:MAG: peptide chain release factor N(5)-glutamine methyltransferase [Candidatus Eremiobacterota bacterium]